MVRRNKLVYGALFIVVLGVVLYAIGAALTHQLDHKIVHDQSLGQITSGQVEASCEIPSEVYAFVLVDAGHEKRLLNGTVTLQANNGEVLAFRFCERDCQLGPIVSGAGAGYYALSPCGSTSGRIDLAKFGGKTVKLKITLDAPNVDPMDLRLDWSN